MRRLAVITAGLLLSRAGVAAAVDWAAPTRLGVSSPWAFFFGLVAGISWVYFVRGGAGSQAAPEPPPSAALAPPPAPTPAVADVTPTESAAARPATDSSRHRSPELAGMEVVEHSDLGQASNADLYQTVAAALQQALASDPSRNDLRYKLLEVLFHATRGADFEREARAYQQHVRQPLESRWPAICEMGRSLAPDQPLYGPPEVEAPGARFMASVPSYQRYYDGLDVHKYCRATEELSEDYARLAAGPELFRKYASILRNQLPRPTPLQWAERVGKIFGATTLLIKREDLRVDVEGEIMNAIGQVLVATELGKRRVLTGSRTGATGIAVARAASMLGIECRVYVGGQAAGSDSTLRHIRSFGASIVRVQENSLDPGSDCRRAALAAWLDEPETSMFISGVDGGPRAQQKIVLDCHGILGRECLEQCRTMGIADLGSVYASTAAGLSALGFVTPFLGRPDVRRVITHDGQLARGPYRREHSWLQESAQVEYQSIELDTAREAQIALARVEGLSISLDDARALSVALRDAVRSRTPSTAILLLTPLRAAPPAAADEERTIRIRKPAPVRERPVSGADFE